MSKTKKKKENYNEIVLIELKAKYGFTRDYILKAIRGDRVGRVPTQIQDEYKRLERAAKMAIYKKVSEL